VKRYELEWRTEFTDYRKVGEQAAIEGHSTYRTKHSAPLAGNNYYRLKVVDEDGKFDYSEEKVVKILANQDVVIYPNPANRDVTIKLGYVSANAKLTLVNSIGKSVFEGSINGVATYSFPVTSLVPGVYFVRITELGKAIVSLPLIIAH